MTKATRMATKVDTQTEKLMDIKLELEKVVIKATKMGTFRVNLMETRQDF